MRCCTTGIFCPLPTTFGPADGAVAYSLTGSRVANLSILCASRWEVSIDGQRASEHQSKTEVTVCYNQSCPPQNMCFPSTKPLGRSRVRRQNDDDGGDVKVMTFDICRT